MNGQVRTWKESEQARGTHKLESTDGETIQEMERIQPSKGHSPTGECRQMDKSGVSGHGKNTTKQGALTNWRVQTDGQVRTWKKSVLSKGHSQTGGHRWMDKSRHGKNPTKQGALTN